MKVNTAVLIKEFWESKQDPGEPVRQFKVKFQGKALSCDFCKDLCNTRGMGSQGHYQGELHGGDDTVGCRHSSGSFICLPERAGEDSVVRGGQGKWEERPAVIG